jgi:hypothetical protein
MIVCPLCEHAQPGGLECELCGRLLTDVSGEAVDPAPLEGLEPTLQEQVAAPAVETFPELQPTGQSGGDAAVAAGAGSFEELLPTLSAPVDDLGAEPVPELERIGEDIPDDERTPYPAVVACRYCGTEGGFGERLCGRCGMRLPVAEPFPAAAEAEGGVRCGCGMLVQGSRCPACGARRSSG